IDTGTHGPPRVKVPRTILRETVPVLAPGRIIVTAKAPDPIRVQKIDSALMRKIQKLQYREYDTFVSHIIVCAE
ncbi:MAG: hypothetical protein Greene041614_686, partial [Parcubacteria group bacterium Greene0416_14]